MGRLTTAIIACLLAPAAASAQPRVEKNVVYGMYSGLALLMDIHRPETTTVRSIKIGAIAGAGVQEDVRYVSIHT